ncbi:MAG: glycerate kinase [Verrucomicrobia bacterium]|nr:glycerate kinase [Verrucomicrobiota bacterium]MDA1047802.1 glycerate kinase [Verrucomicrobiota bacterium]
MRFLVAFDKFKDALSAGDVCRLAREKLESGLPNIRVFESPLTDGGEGFCDILTGAVGGRFSSYIVEGPLGKPVEARIGYVELGLLSPEVRELANLPSVGEVAILEMASAAGLEQVPVPLRDPWSTSTFGVGELVLHAAKDGAAAILLGIGGSATNDLGVGALRALGLRFFDCEDCEIDNVCPGAWSRITRISGELPELPPLRIACDVDNPLLGSSGAAASYGPQKGLLAEDILRMDSEMARMASMLSDKFGAKKDMLTVPGTGAAGGIGFGLGVACGGCLVQGFPLVSAWLQLEEQINDAEVILTGEGRFDSTSLRGKGPGKVLELAHRAGKPVFVLAGSVSDEARREVREVFPSVFLHSIGRSELSLEENLSRTGEFFEQTLQKIVEYKEWTKQ